ncbi:MAG TPA: DUF5906 domain-containing protein [Verrucomicrobiae bacterium]|nr:DUF5906 domain-containing protein [Verrucomicrobiae bacterium]
MLNLLEQKLNISRTTLNKVLKAELRASQSERRPVPLEIYYDSAQKQYWMPNQRGEMIEVNERSVERQLAANNFSTEKNSGLSDLEKEINRIQSEQSVDYAGPLAGHGVGVQEMCGHLILVTRSIKLVQPKPGSCHTIMALIHGLLDDPNHDQISSALGWIKVSYEALASKQPRPGQVLAIAGPPDCGKSLLQNLITEMLGGRAAKPYRYMSGATQFNGDLFGAEHLMIEDEMASTDIRARRNFGTRIKDFTVNTVQSCHPKGRPAVSLKPCWRLSVTVNDEPENLLILPPLDESLTDKIILLKAYKNPLPMETGSNAGRKLFWDTLMAELPMFIHALEKFSIPESIRSDRFGVAAFKHPELLDSLEEMSPEIRLLALIDEVLFSPLMTLEDSSSDAGDKWVGTATSLEKLLSNSTVTYEARRLLYWTNSTATYLGRLAKKMPHRIQRQRTNCARKWCIVSEDYANRQKVTPVTPVQEELSVKDIVPSPS